MNIRDILNVFSNRRTGMKSGNEEVSIGYQSRNRVLFLVRNMMTSNQYSSLDKFLLQIRELFQFKLGVLSLDDKCNNELEEVLSFIINCKGESFLDFLEYIFKTRQVDPMNSDIKNKLVEDINYVFQVDEVPFQLTSYVEEWVKVKASENAMHPFRDALTRSIIAYPQVISKEDDFTYSEITKPVLDLLKDTRFSNANKEFLEALEHYKNSRYKECITSCCSSLESTMKIICKIKGWKYNSNSTFNPLVLLIIEQGKMPKWYENMLITPASIRNKVGSSHGKGDQNVTANKNEARYQINITAAEIIFLIEEIL